LSAPLLAEGIGGCVTRHVGWFAAPASRRRVHARRFE
jgi:hypothetical protein